MAQLIVRNLDDELIRRLKIRAVKKGHSAEAEHRVILEEALLGKELDDFKAALMSMPDVGDDSDFARDLDKGRDIELLD